MDFVERSLGKQLMDSTLAIEVDQSSDQQSSQNPQAWRQSDRRGEWAQKSVNYRIGKKEQGLSGLERPTQKIDDP